MGRMHSKGFVFFFFFFFFLLIGFWGLNERFVQTSWGEGKKEKKLRGEKQESLFFAVSPKRLQQREKVLLS